MAEKDASVILFTRYGLGDGPAGLKQALAVKYLTLLLESGDLPRRILFYTEGVRLACDGSPVLDSLRKLEGQRVELILCKTCLDFLGLNEQVRVGIVGGMPDILETLQQAQKVISL